MMEELSLNILDIVQNAIAADAQRIRIAIFIKDEDNRLTIQVEDDGRGMSQELVRRVTNPFETSRTTRKVGLGIPFFKEAAEIAGGSFSIRSQEGRGTLVRADFQKDHIDRQPLGDVAGTVVALIKLNPGIDFSLRYEVNEETFDFSTAQVKEILGEDGDVSQPEVIVFLSGYLKEHIEKLNGGA